MYNMHNVIVMSNLCFSFPMTMMKKKKMMMIIIMMMMMMIMMMLNIMKMMTKMIMTQVVGSPRIPHLAKG